MAKTELNSAVPERLIDLLERLGAAGLYFSTDLDHKAIARLLGIGTQRVNAILKGLKKLK